MHKRLGAKQSSMQILIVNQRQFFKTFRAYGKSLELLKNN